MLELAELSFTYFSSWSELSLLWLPCLTIPRCAPSSVKASSGRCGRRCSIPRCLTLGTSISIALPMDLTTYSWYLMLSCPRQLTSGRGRTSFFQISARQVCLTRRVLVRSNPCMGQSLIQVSFSIVSSTPRAVDNFFNAGDGSPFT